jgi:hypothetical protein
MGSRRGLPVDVASLDIANYYHITPGCTRRKMCLNTEYVAMVLGMSGWEQVQGLDGQRQGSRSWPGPARSRAQQLQVDPRRRVDEARHADARRADEGIQWLFEMIGDYTLVPCYTKLLSGNPRRTFCTVFIAKRS